MAFSEIVQYLACNSLSTARLVNENELNETDVDVLEHIDIATSNNPIIILADDRLVFINRISQIIIPTKALIGVALNRREELDVEIEQWLKIRIRRDDC